MTTAQRVARLARLMATSRREVEKMFEANLGPGCVSDPERAAIMDDCLDRRIAQIENHPRGASATKRGHTNEPNIVSAE